MASQPNLSIKLYGEETISSLSEIFSWKFNAKSENTVNVQSGQTPIPVNWSMINVTVYPIQQIVFYGNGNYVVTITQGYNVMSFESTGLFIWSPTPASFSNVSSITVSSLSSTPVQVEVRIYA
jgi:hypothetical protein